MSNNNYFDIFLFTNIQIDTKNYEVNPLLKYIFSSLVRYRECLY